MEKKEIYKKMKDLNEMIEDYLDRLYMDEVEESDKKKEEK